MQTDQMVFQGSETEQQLAREIWLAMRMMGASYGEHAPIRQPLATLAEFFGRLPALKGSDDPAAAIDAALTRNDAIFARSETDDGVVAFATTRSGVVPTEAEADQRHMFRMRLTEPEPMREPERPAVEEPPAVEPLRVADVWLRPGSATEATEAEDEEEEAVEEQIAEAEAEETPPVAQEAPAAEEAESVTSGAEAALALELAPSEPSDPAALRQALRERLGSDLRFVSFGDEWCLDDQVMRLSRGDFRRIRDYMIERGEPVSDEEILVDVFGRRTGDRDYDMARFGLNQRMSKEKKEFEFVGASQLRLWSTSALPAFGTAKRKPAELGQDYRFLLESTEGAEEGAAAAAIEHVLTFYEYEYGVLPLDARLAAFFPQPLLEDQRAAALRFEAPQLYLNFLVELRYPTANRGGFLTGLEQFYIENLVPGSRMTIERTDNNGRYIMRLEQTSEQTRKLLSLDERRGRFTFLPVTFYWAVDEDLLLSDTKFPGLNNSKALSDKERRRPEMVLRATFERVGDHQQSEAGGARYWALFDDLLAAANIERPFTAEYLRSLLESESFPEFRREDDAYIYDPALA